MVFLFLFKIIALLNMSNIKLLLMEKPEFFHLTVKFYIK